MAVSRAVAAKVSRALVNRTREIITQPVYDTQTLPTTWAAAIKFFNNTNSAGKAGVKSNMELVGMLPSPKTIRVYGASFTVDPRVSEADLKLILLNASLVFKVASKEYWKGPAWMWCAGGGIAGTGTGINTNGWPVAGNFFKFRHPITINQQVTFSVLLEAPGHAASVTLSAATEATISLWATEARQVQ